MVAFKIPEILFAFTVLLAALQTNAVLLWYGDKTMLRPRSGSLI